MTARDAQRVLAEEWDSNTGFLLRISDISSRLPTSVPTTAVPVERTHLAAPNEDQASVLVLRTAANAMLNVGRQRPPPLSNLYIRSHYCPVKRSK
jgi:hypothetical protein